MTPPIIVREKGPKDAAVICALTCAAFARALEADLVERLRADGDAVLSLQAEEDGMVGHVMLSRMRRPQGALALAPVSVRPDKQRRGTGTRLVRDALAVATSRGYRAVLVLAAPAFYERVGSTAVDERELVSDFAGLHFMAVRFDERPRHGRAEYPPAFAELS